MNFIFNIFLIFLSVGIYTIMALTILSVPMLIISKTVKTIANYNLLETFEQFTYRTTSFKKTLRKTLLEHFIAQYSIKRVFVSPLVVKSFTLGSVLFLNSADLRNRLHSLRMKLR